ncbi:uncharacterized protein LOC119549523 [Drosophila subpulchrella]|uniref:uncharacterized protein LOC119549523 n=1 Tax=Drosophila subpulchrella TaxID=1486046 RepID=UPI0018A157D8|nr:uncharacterized protein LOC119549523 [Drosophila subpulchrella]
MADLLSAVGREQEAMANRKTLGSGVLVEDNVFATKSPEELVLSEDLDELLELRDHQLPDVTAKGWTEPGKKNRSMDLDIYDDLDEMKPQYSTKPEEKDRSLDLDIYDDLDDFQQAEDHKTKELLAWEDKHEMAQAEIQALKTENKALGKKIKAMEVNLQNLLDTAKAEVKRKEALIAQLRKEKDDLCFRRKRVRDVEEPGERDHDSKRLKETQSRALAKKDPETERNPFKTVPKDDAKKTTSKDDIKKASKKEDVKKSDSGSRSPKQGQPKTTERRSSTNPRRPENRHKSRDRRHSRSRSPRHSVRRDQHRSREISSRHVGRRSRSQSPRTKKPEENCQGMNAPFFDKIKVPRGDSPHLELPKTATYLQPSKKGVSKQTDITSEIKTNSLFDIKEHTKDPQPAGGFFSEVSQPKREIIPGLHLISQTESLHFVQDQIELAKMKPKIVENSDFHTAHDQLKKTSTKLDPKVSQLDGKIKNISPQHSTIEVLQLEGEELAKEPSEAMNVRTDTTQKGKDQIELTKAATVHAERDSLVKRNSNAWPAKDIQASSEPTRLNKSDIGIRIIEDIRLPEMADIDHIAVKVDSQCQTPTALTNSASSDQNIVLVSVTPQERRDPICTSCVDDTPTKTADVLYAKPDSTKLDHNDENDEVILEAAMDLLTSEKDPPNIVDPSYPNLSIEEDAIEMALEQLHQQSPDETVVTSTSNRALQTPKQNLITILTRSPIQQSPFKSKTKSKKISPTATPEKLATEKTPLKKRKVNMDSPTQEPPVSRLDFTIDETLATSFGGDDTSTVTKRCSLGHTDYQYEQIKDEVILRVKRRCRRRRPPTAEMQAGAASKPI